MLNIINTYCTIFVCNYDIFSQFLFYFWMEEIYNFPLDRNIKQDLYLPKHPRRDVSPDKISKWAIPFFPMQEYGREILWGCARNIFQGSQGLKLSFQRGQGMFSRGVIPDRISLPVRQWAHT